MKHPLQHVGSHLRSNLVGYLALFVALGGTSYAALTLPNHSIDPVNLNPRYIGGYVRAWASVDANGRIGASSRGVRVLTVFEARPGNYIITWHARPSSRCEATGSVQFSASGAVPGYLITEAGSSPGRGQQSAVQTFNAQGQPAALPFDEQLICATP